VSSARGGPCHGAGLAGQRSLEGGAQAACSERRPWKRSRLKRKPARTTRTTLEAAKTFPSEKTVSVHHNQTAVRRGICPAVQASRGLVAPAGQACRSRAVGIPGHRNAPQADRHHAKLPAHISRQALAAVEPVADPTLRNGEDHIAVPTGNGRVRENAATGGAGRHFERAGLQNAVAEPESALVEVEDLEPVAAVGESTSRTSVNAWLSDMGSGWW